MEQDTLQDMLMNNYTTRTRIVVAQLIRSNRHMQDVSSDIRKIQKLLAEQAATAAAIHSDTRILPGFVKSLKNIFNFGSSEMDRHIKPK